MSEKYLRTKDGSIEAAVVKSVYTPKDEPKKEDKEYKTSLYFGTKEGSVGDAFNKVMNEGLSAGQKKLPPALQKAILKKMKNEKLSGGQKKLDKDKDGDIDGKDFAMLRKSKKEDVSDMNKKKHAAYKDPKRGEHDVVDPKPKLEDAVRNVWQKAGDELEETKDKAQYMKTPPAKTDVSTDTESEQDNDKVKKLKIKLDKEKDTDALEKQNITLQGQVELLKQKLENEKNKAIKPEPNPETGEIPLTVGVAYKALRDKMKKEEVKDNPDIVDDNETKKEKSKGKALTGSPKTVVDTDPKVDYKN